MSLPEKRHLLVDLSTGETRPALPVAPELSSAGGPWRGMILEWHGAGGPDEVEDVAAPEHLVVGQLEGESALDWRDNGHYRRVRLVAGQWMLIPAMMPFSCRSERRGRIAGLSIEPRFLRYAAHDLLTGPDRIELQPGVSLGDPLVPALLHTLLAEVKGGYLGGPMYGELLGTALAAHLVRHYSNVLARAEPRGGGLTRQQLRRVIDYIHDHLEGEVSLNALAGEAGLSPFHFARRFKQSTGRSPHQYVLQCRIERAREFLVAGLGTASEIAVRAGFCDQSHLTTHFKRAFGVTPREFRRRMAHAMAPGAGPSQPG